MARGARVDLRPVDRDPPHVRQPSLRAQPQHVAKEPRQRSLVALAKPRDRRVIGHLVRRDHPDDPVSDLRYRRGMARRAFRRAERARVDPNPSLVVSELIASLVLHADGGLNLTSESPRVPARVDAALTRFS